VFALLAASTVIILFSPLVCACDTQLTPTDDLLLFFVGGSDCHGDIIETSLNLAALVALVWFLNRELEMRFDLKVKISKKMILMITCISFFQLQDWLPLFIIVSERQKENTKS